MTPNISKAGPDTFTSGIGKIYSFMARAGAARLSIADPPVNHKFYIERAAAKRSRKAARGPGFARVKGAAA